MPHRFYQLLLVAIGVGGVVVQIVSVGPLRTSFWGFHLHAFLPIGAGIASWAIVAVGAVLLLRGQSERFVSMWERLDAGHVASPRRVVPLLVLCSAAGFWFLASEQTVLGDAWPLVQNLPSGQNFHPRQPLTMALQQVVYQGWSAVVGSDGDPFERAQQSVALVSVASGVLFALVAYSLARVLVTQSQTAPSASAPRRTRPRARPRSRRQAADTTEPGASSDAVALLVSLVLLSQGYVQLFFGYLENYATYALSLAVYTWAALLQLRGRLPLVVPLLLFVLNLGVHLSSVVLLPSVVLLCGRELARAPRRTIRDVLLAAVALVLLDRALASLSRDYSLWGALVGIVKTGLQDQGGGSGVGYLLSLRHHRDFLNEHFLIGPLGSFLFVPALLFVVWPGRADNTLRLRGFARSSATFLAVAAGALWLSTWATAEPALGYARDWDLFAPTGVVFTVAGLAFLVHQVRDSGWRVRLLAYAWLVSAVHLTSWVWVNHSETRSMERFATLPLGLGRTEVVLGNWHWRNGRTDTAVEWFEKALRVNPRSNTAYSFLGIIYGNQGRMDLAAEAYRRAVQIRPDQITYRTNLVRALDALSLWEEALAHYEMLCRTQPYTVEHWLGWGRALRNLGRHVESRQTLERAVTLFSAEQERSPADYQANTNVGALLTSLERHDDALHYFMRALQAEPQSDNALYNVGASLMRLGRVQEARPYLQRLLQINPEHFRRDEVQAWIAGTGSN